MRRRHRREPQGGALELLRHAELVGRAAERGEPGAAERSMAANSWVEMAAGSGWDPEIVGLFVTFAREDVPHG